MSMFRQGIIVAFVIGTMLNAWFVIGAVGGYTYYADVSPLDGAGATQTALWIEIALILLGILAWWLSISQDVSE